jgi:hypothetical protein
VSAHSANWFSCHVAAVAGPALEDQLAPVTPASQGPSTARNGTSRRLTHGCDSAGNPIPAAASFSWSLDGKPLA